MNGEWFPGRHEAIITPEQFAAAHRGRVKGRARGTDLLSGRVRCGLCRRLMAIDQNGQGAKLYRCHHRGQGCAQPRRTNVGLLRAAVLGLRLIGDDVELQAAIRTELERARTPAPKAGGGPRARRIPSRCRGPGGPAPQAAAPLLRRQDRGRPVRRGGGAPVRGHP